MKQKYKCCDLKLQREFIVRNDPFILRVIKGKVGGYILSIQQVEFCERDIEKMRRIIHEQVQVLSELLEALNDVERREVK